MIRIFNSIFTLNTIYIVFLLLGACFAIITHFLSRKAYKNFGIVTAIFALSLCLALLLSTSLIVFFNSIIEQKHTQANYLTNFSFLFTSIIFVALVLIFCKIFSINFEQIKQSMTLCLMVFLLFAKLGCLFNGCCNSRLIGGIVLHFSLYESIFAALLIALYSVKKTNIFNVFFLIYLPYRILSEFIRDSYEKQVILWNFFTPTQIMASIAFVIISVAVVVKHSTAQK